MASKSDQACRWVATPPAALRLRFSFSRSTVTWSLCSSFAKCCRASSSFFRMSSRFWSMRSCHRLSVHTETRTHSHMRTYTRGAARRLKLSAMRSAVARLHQTMDSRRTVSARVRMRASHGARQLLVLAPYIPQVVRAFDHVL